MISANEFKEPFESVSSERYEVDSSVIEGVIARVNDLIECGRAREANEMLNEMPEKEEIVDAMKEMNDSAPGEDDVRLRYIREACEEVKERVIECMQRIVEVRANRWEERFLSPLFKKGDRNYRNNYRGVSLLSMCSRVLANRIGWWSEWISLLDENQADFRKSR